MAKSLTLGQVPAQEETPQDDYETSEMLMYKAMVLEEGGKLEDALAHLAAAKACLLCCKRDMHSINTFSNMCCVNARSGVSRHSSPITVGASSCRLFLDSSVCAS